MSGVQTERLTRRGLRLAQFTVAYNVIEGIVAVTAGLLAGLVSASLRPDWSIATKVWLRLCASTPTMANAVSSMSVRNPAQGDAGRRDPS